MPSAIEVSGFKPGPYLSRAETYLLLGDKERAIAALDRGLRVNPEDPRLLKARGEFGWRESRAVATLPRGHLVNRSLGRLRWLMRPGAARSGGLRDYSTLHSSLTP